MVATRASPLLTKSLQEARRKVWQQRLRRDEAWREFWRANSVLQVSAEDSWNDLWSAMGGAAAAALRWALRDEVRARAEYYRLLNLLRQQDASLVRGPAAQIPTAGVPVPSTREKTEAIAANVRKKIYEHFREVDEKNFDPEREQKLVDGYASLVYECLQELERKPTYENILKAMVYYEPVVRGATGPSPESTGLPGDIRRGVRKALREVFKETQQAFARAPTAGNFLAKLCVQERAPAVELNLDDTQQRLHEAHRGRFKPAEFHTVKPGESLPHIARIYYGDAKFWDVLYLENRGKLDRAHPDCVTAGTVLKIP